MINGIMTLSGAWDRLRTDPVLRMMVVSLAFYGMSTFEGPLMSIKAVNGSVALHRLDHRPCPFRRARLGRLHLLRRDLLPRALAVEPQGLYSLKLVSWHFWVSTLGIVLYISAMWVSGILQGLMWRAYTSLGFLEYSFIETVAAMHPFYVIRAMGGALFLIGALIMAFNLWMTVRSGSAGRDAAFRRAVGPRWPWPSEELNQHDEHRTQGSAPVALGEARRSSRPELDRPGHRRAAGGLGHRRPGRDRAALLPEGTIETVAGHAALHAARAAPAATSMSREAAAATAAAR